MHTIKPWSGVRGAGVREGIAGDRQAGAPFWVEWQVG